MLELFRMKKTALAVILAAVLQWAASGLSVGILPLPVYQGRTIFITVGSPEHVSRIRAEFLSQKIDLYPEGEYFTGVIGVPCDQKPGSYPLRFEIVKNDGKTEEFIKDVIVKKFPFPSASFWLKPSKKKLLASNLIQEEWARIEKELGVESSEKKWAENFTLPSEGPFSMRFGTIEKVNGKKRGQHRGLDIAVPTGTKIAAVNHGKVVFSEKLKAFGNTIVIDHGRGVHSLYFHLSKLLAKVGDEVGKGSIIGLSGNTGISSGPHLHWGMSVHNLRVDPGQWAQPSP